MNAMLLRLAEQADAAAVSEVVIGLEVSLFGSTRYTQSDLEAEWRGLDLARNACVIVDGDRIVGYGSMWDRGELWRLEVCLHPDFRDAGVGARLVEAMEQQVAERGGRRAQVGVFEPDERLRHLLQGYGYRPVRVFREMRIEHDVPPAQPFWPTGLRVAVFDRARDALAFHAAQQEAFSDHWEYTRRDFASWCDWHFGADRFDPDLWCVVRDGDEIAGGACCKANRYGGGWVDVLFIRRPWRGRGVGAALLQDVFVRFWERGERNVGLTVDAESATGAFRLYERAGMRPVLGWVMFEKQLR